MAPKIENLRMWLYYGDIEQLGTSLQKRKVLYNAITRAKRNVVIIVQHKSNSLEDLATIAATVDLAGSDKSEINSFNFASEFSICC